MSFAPTWNPPEKHPQDLDDVNQVFEVQFLKHTLGWRSYLDVFIKIPSLKAFIWNLNIKRWS